MKENFKKKAKVAGTAALAATLIITGSLAWQDVSQHKTSNFGTKSTANSMVLVEDFKPVNDWMPGVPTPHTVFVRNGQESDANSKYTFSDGYVRLQLREFLGIGDASNKESEERLMIDTKGNFVRGVSEDDVIAKAAALGVTITAADTKAYKGASDDKTYYYVKTKAGDINGQYGKFLLLDLTTDNLKSVTTGQSVTVEELEKDAKENHNGSINANSEDSKLFNVHLWQNGADGNTKPSNISEYVELNLGNDVITFEDWKASGAKAGNKWVLDTTSNEGWVYWLGTLTHSPSKVAGSFTSNILESVSLRKETAGRAEYRLHTNMDSVSKDSLGKWTDAPSEILSALGKVEGEDTSAMLATLSNTVESFKTASYLKESQVVLEHLDTYDLAISALNDNTRALSNSYLSKLNSELLESVSVVSALEQVNKIGQRVYFDLDSKLEMVASNIDNKGNIMLSVGKGITKEMAQTLNISQDIKDHINGNKVGYVPFYMDRAEYKGYKNSVPQIMTEAFYNDVLSVSDYADKIQYVTPFEELAYGRVEENPTSDYGNFTHVDPNGEKRAFIPSIKDIRHQYVSGKEGFWPNLGSSAKHYVMGMKDYQGKTIIAVAEGFSDSLLGYLSPTDINGAVKPCIWVSR